MKLVAVIWQGGRMQAVTPVSGITAESAEAHAELWRARGYEASTFTVKEWRRYARTTGTRTHTKGAR